MQNCVQVQLLAPANSPRIIGKNSVLWKFGKKIWFGFPFGDTVCGTHGIAERAWAMGRSRDFIPRFVGFLDRVKI